MIAQILPVFITLVLGIGMGYLLKKTGLPAILAWLFVGIVVGPFGLQWISSEIMNASWYIHSRDIAKFLVGTMMGIGMGFTRNEGKRVLAVALYESFGTLLVVSILFIPILSVIGKPFYLAFIIAAIAMATSAASAMASIKSFQAKGPLTDLLIPVLSLDKIIGLTVFMIVLGFTTGAAATGTFGKFSFVVSILVSILSGMCIGILGGFFINKLQNTALTTPLYASSLLIAALLFVILNHYVFGTKAINYLLAGISVAAALSNTAGTVKTIQIKKQTAKGIGVIFAFFILSLSATMDYRLIFQLGVPTVFYIASRFAGKMLFATLGGQKSGYAKPVWKNLGFTLLPHASVCLVFTSMAYDALEPMAYNQAVFLQSTLFASVIINEIMAAFLMKFALRRAGEIER